MLQQFKNSRYTSSHLYCMLVCLPVLSEKRMWLIIYIYTNRVTEYIYIAVLVLELMCVKLSEKLLPSLVVFAMLKFTFSSWVLVLTVSPVQSRCCDKVANSLQNCGFWVRSSSVTSHIGKEASTGQGGERHNYKIQNTYYNYNTYYYNALYTIHCKVVIIAIWH